MIVRTILERESGGTTPDDCGYYIGTMGVAALDQYLHGSEVPLLGDYMCPDITTLERALDLDLDLPHPADASVLEERLMQLRQRPLWHDPRDGLRTIEELLARLPIGERHEGVRSDLECYRQWLQETAAANDRFRLNVVTHE